MNNAIIFIKNENEEKLASARILGKQIVAYTVEQLKKSDIDNIYLIGAKDLDCKDVLKRTDVKDVVNDIIQHSGRSILMSPLYPFADQEIYHSLLNAKGSVTALNKGIFCEIFALDNDKLTCFEHENITAYDIGNAGTKISSLADVADYSAAMKRCINDKLLSKGVSIIDPDHTFIGPDVLIDKGTTIYPNVIIEGKCQIGCDNMLMPNSYFSNVVIGDRNYIEGCYLKDCIVEDDCSILNNATTVNLRGGITLISSHAYIGAGATLIAPVKIGEYGIVASGSTIDTDVRDGDMAISRLYQTNKRGYGYKYMNREN